jgi:hypothetical protein
MSIRSALLRPLLKVVLATQFPPDMPIAQHGERIQTPQLYPINSVVIARTEFDIQ